MKQLISALIFISCATAASAQSLTARPSPDGIWILLTDAGTNGNTVSVMRAAGSGAAEEILRTGSPRNYSAFAAGFERAAAHTPHLAPIDEAMMKNIYDRYTRTTTLDSMGMWGDDLRVLTALGLAVFDDGATANARYTYSVATDGGRSLSTSPVSYPAAGARIGALKPLLIQPTKQGVYLEFEVTDKGTMQGCNIYRSYYLRTGPQRISPLVTYSVRGTTFIAAFTDLTATPRVAYSYYAVPFDAAGNEGTASAPANLFHAPAYTIPPSVRHLTATSDDARKAIKLSWLRPTTPDLVSVEVYKSDTYTGVYKKIASLQPKDTVYYDEAVSPITTQYYTVALNGTYEQSVNSPRVPGILNAVEQNYLPPQDVSATQNGRVVTLAWSRSERDTKGYYIYRGTGYRGALRKITPRINNERDSILSYRDTLPPTLSPTVYTYAITDENGSYNESSESERASIQYIPVAADRPMALAQPRILPADDGSLQIVWASLSEKDMLVEGYVVHRTVRSATGAVLEEKNLTPSPIKRSLFVDKDARQEGAMYSYAIHTIDAGSGESENAGIAEYTVPEVRPLQVSNIRALGGDGVVALNWNVPVGTDATAVHLYRSHSGAKPEEITALTMTASAYKDDGVKRGEVYYYFFITEGPGGKMSEATVPVSVALD